MNANYKRLQNHIHDLEIEYKQPFKEVVEDYASHVDYMGYGYGIYFVSKLLGIDHMTLRKYCKQEKITFVKAKGNVFPSKLADNCWVKWGCDLYKFMKYRYHWYTNEEMSLQLNCNTQSIIDYGIKFGLTGKILSRRHRRTKMKNSTLLLNLAR